MGLTDYLLMAAIGIALILAARVCIRSRKKGKTCSGDCANCSCGCGK